MAVPAFETIGKAPAFDDIPAAVPPDMATLPDEQFPEETRSVATRIRNAYYYARNLGISTDEAWDYEPQINEALYGPGTTSEGAWGRTRKSLLGARRKTVGESASHGWENWKVRSTNWVAGLGRQAAEVKGLQASLLDPAFRWMFNLPKDINLDKLLVDISDAAAADFKQHWQDHPEMGYAIDPDAGYVEALEQVLTRPENLVQGLVENVPMMLEGVLGTIVAGPAGGIAAMAVPISGEVYQDARGEGTDILPAFAQAVATGGIEAAIEQWTLARKIGLAKNITRILADKPGRKILWEGTKAFFRGTAEEYSQQFNANFWRWLLTDRSQKWFEGVQQAAALGGPLEAVMGGAFAAAGRVASPVTPQEAQRRLDVLRQGVRASNLSASQKQEILAEIDKAVAYVPDIVLGKAAAKAREEADRGEAKAESATSTTGPAEGGPTVRDAGAQATAAAPAVPDAGTAVEAPPAPNSTEYGLKRVGLLADLKYRFSKVRSEQDLRDAMANFDPAELQYFGIDPATQIYTTQSVWLSTHGTEAQAIIGEHFEVVQPETGTGEALPAQGTPQYETERARVMQELTADLSAAQSDADVQGVLEKWVADAQRSQHYGMDAEMGKALEQAAATNEWLADNAAYFSSWTGIFTSDLSRAALRAQAENQPGRSLGPVSDVGRMVEDWIRPDPTVKATDISGDLRLRGNEAIESIDREWGQYVEAHGIAKGSPAEQVRQLESILQNGIDPTRTLHTANLTKEPGAQQGSPQTGGGTANYDGLFILAGGKGGIRDGNFVVLVNPAVPQNIMVALQTKYPGTRFAYIQDAQAALATIGPVGQVTAQGAGAATTQPGTSSAGQAASALPEGGKAGTIPAMVDDKGVGGKQTPSTPQAAQGAKQPYAMSVDEFVAQHGDTPDIRAAWRGHVRRAVQSGKAVPEANRIAVEQSDAERERKTAAKPVPDASKAPRTWAVVPQSEQFDPRQPKDDGFYYHVTAKENADAILQQGLVPGKRQSMDAGRLADRSKGKLFLTDRGGVEFWKMRIAQHLESQGRKSDVVVLRVPKSVVGTLDVDTEGTTDAKANAYVTDKAISFNPSPRPQSAGTPVWGSTNTGVTRAEYDAILASRKAKGKLVGGRAAGGTILFNPEEWLDLVRVGRFHLEAGARAFADWAKRMVVDFGPAVETELDKVWAKVQTLPGEEENQLEETPEEAKVAEAKLAGEGAETVEPMLYIGNVTARMKDMAARALSTSTGKPVEAKAIGPFKEGAWPTKRTRIKMTRAEAEAYLAWLEKDIQHRLKYNLINTYEDMAEANADWGDVKALRRVLGITEKMTADIKAAKKERTRLKKELKRIQKQQAKPSGPNKMTPAHAATRIEQLEKAIANTDDIIASAGRPWRIIYAQPRGTVLRDQGEIKAAYAEIERLREEWDRAKTEPELEEILAQIEAKQLEIHKLQQAAGKSAKIIKKTSESVMGSVQPSRLDESKMTVQEVLRAVMKRGARFAKMGHAEGRRELRAEMRTKAQAKARMQKAIDTIKRAVPATVDVVYREAIEAIKNSMDPSFRSDKALAKRESTREYLKRHPEKAAEMPTRLLDTLGKKPLNEYTIEELETIAAKIEQLKELGGLRRKLETTQYERGKHKDLQAIAAGSTPLTERDMIRPEKIGQELTFEQRAKNTLSRLLNAAAAAKRAVAQSMDVFFDMLDGGTAKYNGPNYRIFKQTLDVAFSKYKQLRHELSIEVVALANELGMERGNYERIGVHAALQQEGGRQKLLDTGYTEQQIDEVKLTADELRLYDLMRQKLDELAPAIEDVMANVYNEPLQKVRNYFSFMTDFEAMSDFEMRERFGDRVVEFSNALRKNPEQGFTVTRRGGFQKIKINAMEIFLQHVDNASYLVEMGADIRRLAEIAGTAEYGQAVGDVGQREVREWLDLMARKGKSDRNKSIRMLDIFRKHTGAAMIGFKLSSALVNMTPLLDGAGLIGRYAFQGASDVATNPQWRAFLMKNFPELRDRVGGDIEFMEFGNSGLEKVERAGFWLLQKIDGLTAASIASGAYQKYLDENKLALDFENANPEAVAYAQRIMRRSQSSAFFKDLPSAFTRGTFTGNKSVDRLLLQFQSFVLNRWSLIEHDMLRAGIKGGNMGQAMNIFLWLSIAGFAEIGLRRLTKELVAMLTGDELDDWSETFTEEMILNSLQNIPFVSQAVSTYNYGNIPVPTLSLLQDMAEKWEILKRTKDPDKKRLKALELLIMTGGTAAGIPGTLQVSEIVRSATKQQRERKMPKH